MNFPICIEESDESSERWCKFALSVCTGARPHVGGAPCYIRGRSIVLSLGAFPCACSANPFQMQCIPLSDPLQRYTESFQGTTRKSLNIIDQP